MAKTKVHIWIEPKQLERLKAESRKTGAPVAELVRRAIDKYLGSK